jgi:hypothetical protein
MVGKPDKWWVNKSIMNAYKGSSLYISDKNIIY